MDCQIEEKQLEKIVFGIREAISPHLANDFDVFAESFYDHISVCVRGFVFGEDVDEIKIRYPATWWDAVKDRWYPRWAKRRWPVLFESHCIDVKRIYPTLSLHNCDSVVIAQVVKELQNG